VTDLIPSNSDGENAQETLISSVDGITRARAGSLSAHGLSDMQIADILLLSIEQVISIRGTDEFKKKYAEEADRAIQAQIDRDEGWDAVEEKSLEVLIETLKFNRDPKFALLAAKTANSAKRPSKEKTNAPHVIDPAANNGGTTNIIVLNLNKNYTDKAAAANSSIDITPRPEKIPQRRSDLPSPKIVENLLAPIKDKLGETVKPLTELEQAFKDAGVVFDKDNDK
jgi:hypothetical protein